MTDHTSIKPEPARVPYLIQRFDHGLPFLALGVCGHWWQGRDDNGTGLIDQFDCPRCGRPAGHVHPTPECDL